MGKAIPESLASTNLKPFQGLKQGDTWQVFFWQSASTNLKPFQGLKRASRCLGQRRSRFNQPKTLSGIETVQGSLFIPFIRASTNLKPFQGLKRSGGSR